MSTKSPLPNQCVVLHERYGADDCCLCRERAETATLRARVEQLEAQVAAAQRAEIGKITSHAEREVIEAAISRHDSPTLFRANLIHAVMVLLKERGGK